MATTVAVDDELLERAMKLGGEKTKKATVTEALREYIARREQATIVEDCESCLGAWSEHIARPRQAPLSKLRDPFA